MAHAFDLMVPASKNLKNPMGGPMVPPPGGPFGPPFGPPFGFFRFLAAESSPIDPPPSDLNWTPTRLLLGEDSRARLGWGPKKPKKNTKKHQKTLPLPLPLPESGGRQRIYG